MSTIFPFNTKQLPLLEQAGGKALSLIEMTRAGMPVPPGFVLAVDFFTPWLDALKRSPHWSDLKPDSVQKLGAATGALQTLARTLTFTAEQKQELEQALVPFHQANHKRLYAVRSSSPEEDLEGASFAGGYETTLGVTVDGIEAAILHSFVSSFDERVFLYKKEHGFSLTEPRIAVIVQQQVHADSAGVAFSLNPLNNCFDEAVINANHGLGESVAARRKPKPRFGKRYVRWLIILSIFLRKRTSWLKNYAPVQPIFMRKEQGLKRKWRRLQMNGSH